MENPGFSNLAPITMHHAFTMRARMQYAADELMKELSIPIEGQVLQTGEKDAVLHILREGSKSRDTLSEAIMTLHQLSSPHVASDEALREYDRVYDMVEKADTLLSHMIDVVREVHKRHHMHKVSSEVPDFLKAIVLHSLDQAERADDD